MQKSFSFDQIDSNKSQSKNILDGLNAEQKKAVSHKNGPLLIIAGAGTGKTTVISRRIAYIIEQKWAKPSEILSLTFTDKAAGEMEERVDKLVPYGYVDMWISTFHAFGDRLLRDFSIDLGLPANFKVLTGTEQAIFLRQNIFAFDLKYFRPPANPLSHIEVLLSHFSRLKDELIAPETYVSWAQDKTLNIKNKKEKEEEYIESEKTLELANAYQRYCDLMMQTGNLDFGDQIFLTYKLLKENKKVLNDCHKKFKYILVDEYQDTNYAQNEIVKLLAGKNGNITVVGDDDQCLPPDSNILTPCGEKPIKDLKVGEKVITAVGKGHISISKINKIFSKQKLRTLITFRTERGKKITVTDNHKMFCYIPNHTKGYWYVYLMERQNLGWRLGITNDLVTRLRLERSADKIVGLKACASEDEARYFEMLWALTYSIPMGCFKERSGIAIKGKWLDKLYKHINTEICAQKLADDLNIDLDSHHFCLDGVVRGNKKRIVININICQRKYISKSSHFNRPLANPKIVHELSLQTSDKFIIDILKTKGFSLQKANKGYRLKIQRKSSEEIKKLSSQVQQITGGIIENKFTLAFFHHKTEPSLVMPASNVLEGHYLPIVQGNKIVYDRIISKKVESKIIRTYDLEIDRTHNFIADNIVVHNSIYRFRGASISNILDFNKSYDKVTQIVLNKNYRSTQEILDASYKLIQHNNPDRLEIQNKINKKLISISHGEIPELLHCATLSCEADTVAKRIIELIKNHNYQNNDFAILVRANNQAEPFMQSLNMQGLPYIFSGAASLFSQPEIKMLIAFLKILVNENDNLSFFELATSELYNIKPSQIVPHYVLAKKQNGSILSTIENNDELMPIAEDIIKYQSRLKELTSGELLYDYLKYTGCLKKLSTDPDVADEIKIQNIAKFFDRIAQFDHASTSRGVLAFLESLELILEVGDDTASTEIDTDLNAINILTAHASKGLEYKVVFIANCVSGRFPSKRRADQLPIPDELIRERLPEGDFHLQEERRLFYVAATRAKEYLFLTSADDYGGKRAKKLSQFVMELLDEPQIEKLKHRLSPLEKIERYQKIDGGEKKIEGRQKKEKSILKLSRQQIDDYYTCPKKYYYAHIIKIPLLENQQLMYGTAIHAALDHYFNRKLKGEKINLKQLIGDYDRAFKNVGFITREHEELRHKQGIETLTKFYNEDQKSKETPSGVEVVFEFFEDGVKINGRYDAIFGLGDKAEIRDFKTSDVKDQKDANRRIKESTQMMIYALAWFEKNKVIPKTTLHFIESNLKGEIVFREKDLIKTKEMIFVVAYGIKSETYGAKPEMFSCRYCPYRDICQEAI